MKLKSGNIWTIYDSCGLLVFTGNNTIKSNGALVMGKGLAKEVRDRFPGIDLEIGKRIEGRRIYGLVLVPDFRIGALQVKYNFADQADLGLINYSIKELAKYARSNKKLEIHINFPGIGYGRLNKEDVLPIIETLPDNVSIWVQ